LVALRTNQLVSGPHLKRFERKIANHARYSRCVTTANGFSALHLALIVTGAAGGNVLVPAVSSCFAVLQAVTAAGCKAIFCDVDSMGRLDADYASELAESTKFSGILAPSHFGIPADIEALRQVGVPVIEDAAQGILSLTDRKSPADALILSFYPSKLLNAVDGGALLVNNDAWETMARDRIHYDHQISDDGVQRFNYRMSNLHAALGLVSLEALPAMKQRLRFVWERYSEVLSFHADAVSLIRSSHGFSGESRFVIALPSPSSAERFLALMNERGVGASREFVMLAGADSENAFPVASRLMGGTVSLPMFPDIRDDEVEHVVESMNSALNTMDL